MSVNPGDNKSVTLLPLDKTIKQSLDMVLFSITDFALVNATYPEEGIRMTITLKRKIMSEMMTTYFPSLLLMMITYATTFFKPFFFEAALSVNLTTMLVMTTIFISKMESLPPTSDIKMIDIWLILCQLVPFVQVVLLTAIEYIREEDKEGKEVEKIVEHQGSPIVKENQPVEKGVDLTKEKPKPKEAWVPMNTEPARNDIMHKLLTIGRYIDCCMIFFQNKIQFLILILQRGRRCPWRCLQPS